MAITAIATVALQLHEWNLSPGTSPVVQGIQQDATTVDNAMLYKRQRFLDLGGQALSITLLAWASWVVLSN
ncbi:hypothetical protein KCU99_g7533, partial [Aureobasidium melanogenum]